MKSVLSVATILLFSSLMFGQSLGLKEVGGAVGYASVSFSSGTSSESFGGFAISAHANLGEIIPQLELFPELQYFSTSKDIGGSTWKVSDFAINANVHYNIKMEGQIAPYVGGGLGYNSFSTEWSAPSTFIPGYGTVGGGTVSGSTGRLGLNLLAGANFSLNEKMKIFVEPRYVLASDFNHFLFKAGVSVALN